MVFYEMNVALLDGFVHNILIDQMRVIITLIRWQEKFSWSITALKIKLSSSTTWDTSVHSCTCKRALDYILTIAVESQ